MELELNSDDIKKLLSTMSLEEIENRLDSNNDYFQVRNHGATYYLAPKISIEDKLKI